MKQYKVIVICVLAIATPALASVFAQTTSCVNLQNTMQLGSTDVSSGGEVSILQKFLHDSDFLLTQVGGTYDEATVVAVKAFQKYKGISITGSTGPVTRSAIQKDTCTLARSSNPNNPSQVAGKGTSGVIVATQATAQRGYVDRVASEVAALNNKVVNGVTGAVVTLSGVSSASAQSKNCINIKGSLYRGHESSSVTKLQEFLNQRGFLSEKPTGFFGDLTIAAVKAYQNSVGLKETGMVFDFTRQAIKQETCNE